MVYFDTDAFHWVGEAFAKQILPLDLRRRIVLSPITFIEVLSHFTLKKNADVLAHIQAIHNWVDPSRALLLPWPDAAVAKAGFGVEMKDKFIDRVENTINHCLATNEADDFREAAGKLKDYLDGLKDRTAKLFGTLVEGNRKNPLKPGQFSGVWLNGMAQRAKVEPNSKPLAEVLSALSAHHEFDESRLAMATQNPEYKPDPNDILDVEQLVYLSDPQLHFVTCDGGYLNRVKVSPQRARIHRLTRDELIKPSSVESILREVTGMRSALPAHYASAILEG